jgi:hypothetical protein
VFGFGRNPLFWLVELVVRALGRFGVTARPNEDATEAETREWERIEDVRND